MLWAWEQLGSGLASGSEHFPWPAEHRLAGATTPQRTSSGYDVSGSECVIDEPQRAMNSPHVVYVPRPDAEPETELSALAAVYMFVLESKKAAGLAPEPNDRDGARVKGDSADAILPH